MVTGVVPSQNPWLRVTRICGPSSLARRLSDGGLPMVNVPGEIHASDSDTPALSHTARAWAPGAAIANAHRTALTGQDFNPDVLARVLLLIGFQHVVPQVPERFLVGHRGVVPLHSDHL